MIRFTKMHGIGNDFVMVNAITQDVEAQAKDLAVAVCDRRFGIGSDGLILATKGRQAPFAMRMWNPDGSESEMCGNGVRCLAHFLRDEGLTNDEEIPVETGNGVLKLSLCPDDKVRVDMGIAGLTKGQIGMVGPPDERFIDQDVPGTEFRGTAVSMGNPHLVVFVPDASKIQLDVYGPRLEHCALFPNRVNVHFVSVQANGSLLQKTWERGAGPTLACGTGACAVVVAAFLNGHSGRQALVHLPGGDLFVEYHESGQVYMTGPAETVFVGEWP